MSTAGTVIPFGPRRGRAPVQGADSRPEVLTVRETAAYLRLSLGTTYGYVADGTIPAQRIGRRWVVLRSLLEAWLDSCTEGGEG